MTDQLANSSKTVLEKVHVIDLKLTTMMIMLLWKIF